MGRLDEIKKSAEAFVSEHASNTSDNPECSIPWMCEEKEAQLWLIAEMIDRKPIPEGSCFQRVGAVDTSMGRIEFHKDEDVRFTFSQEHTLFFWTGYRYVAVALNEGDMIVPYGAKEASAPTPNTTGSE